MKVRSLIPALAMILMVLLPQGALAEPSAAPADSSSQLMRVLELTNAQRVAAGLLPLRWNQALSSAAAAHAGDMAARGYFAHNSPEGVTPTDRAKGAGYEAYGWGGHYVGENLARGYASSEDAFRGWMESPGHRANILNGKYREMGAALVTGPGGVRVWAQEFGSRPNELGLFIDSDAPVAGGEGVELSIGREEVSDWGSLGEPERMMVSNRADFAGAAWEPYAPRKAWRLEGAGRVGVYVRLVDGEGRLAQASDEIALSLPALAEAEAPVAEGMHREMAAAPAPLAVEEDSEETAL